MSNNNGVLFIDDDYKSCRICHEQDLESCKILESPCHCSGTLKFAHRDCIQRWCDEKGNTTCEICLQKFKPGYTAPAIKKLQLIHTISVVVARNEPEMETSEEILETEGTICISAVDISAAYRRSLALMLTILLLMKNCFDLVSGGTRAYSLPLITVFIVKSTGIIVPMYMLFRITSVIHNSINHQHYYQNFDSDVVRSSSEDGENDEHINGNDNV